MLKKEFVPHEEALALKELGFDEPCLKFYAAGILALAPDAENGDTNSKLNGYNPLYVSAPTFSQAFRFFREKYNKLSPIDHATGGWYFVIREIGGSTDPMLKAVCGSGFQSYEEAELACLRQLIEIVQGDTK